MAAVLEQTRCARAEQTPVYGMRPVGGFGVRGWRVWCPGCGFLSHLYTSHRGCQDALYRHRRHGDEKGATA